MDKRPIFYLVCYARNKAYIGQFSVGGWPSDRFYHTEEDTPDKVCANGVKAVADIVASVVMRLASQ